jgi:hypothetical protein
VAATNFKVTHSNVHVRKSPKKSILASNRISRVNCMYFLLLRTALQIVISCDHLPFGATAPPFV